MGDVRCQDELEALKPVLANSQEDTELLMEEIKDKLPGVEAKRTEVQADAAVAEAEAAKCLKAKQSVEEDLSVAMPALNAAIKVSCDVIKACVESDRSPVNNGSPASETRVNSV